MSSLMSLHKDNESLCKLGTHAHIVKPYLISPSEPPRETPHPYKTLHTLLLSSKGCGGACVLLRGYLVPIPQGLGQRGG